MQHRSTILRLLLLLLCLRSTFGEASRYAVSSLKMSAVPTTMLPILPQLNAQFRIVLGSASPRRQELLRLIGLSDFDVVVSNFAEDLDRATFPKPSDYCAATAYKKVQAVAALLSKNDGVTQKTLVIGADTIVEIDGEILEKPTDDAESRRMLRSLSGREQLVHTAVVGFSNSNTLDGAIVSSTTDFPHEFKFVETSKVKFAALSDADIEAYIATGEGKDKAGSYGIQGIGGQLVESVGGCYFNVMGLPIHSLSKHIAALLVK